MNARRLQWRTCARALLGGFAALLAMAGPAGAAERPNIVLMLGDNVGFGVLSSYNGGALNVQTPRLDGLAAQGIRLTNFNVENQCTPSRAALMTGRMPIRSGIGKAAAATSKGGLHTWEVTLAEMLSAAGYRTAMFGKWHLGTSRGRVPTDQGFDEWIGFESTDQAYWADKPGYPLSPALYLREARKGEEPREIQSYGLELRRDIDHIITRHSVDFIAAHAKDKQPFFLYVPFAFAHHPALANKAFAGKSSAGEFGDSVLEHDYNVGRILDALKAQGLDNNTLVIYASDNGPSPLSTVTPDLTSGDSGPWRGEIGTVLEGNLRTPFIARWPGKIPAGLRSNEMVSILDVFPTLAHIAGGKVPDDRPVDGVDQTDFMLGKQQTSNRDAGLFFLGDRLMALKWHQYKIHFAGLDRVDGVVEEWSFPRGFNLDADPKERFNVLWQNTWLTTRIGPLVTRYKESIKRYPNLTPGMRDDQLPQYGSQ